MKNFRNRFLFTACGIILLAPHLLAQKKDGLPDEKNNGIDRPKIVIGLVVDQMRWDYLYRYFNRYGEGGFKRLMKKGYSFENTFIPYAPAVTAAGHTCLYTGSVAALHGIVANDWVNGITGDTTYCTSDKSVSSVGTFSNQGKMSPKNLLVTTIGDELRLATNFKSRVFGIALKDRGGILPAGQSGMAYWLDDSTGNWITSSYYIPDLKPWVKGFNKARKIDSMMTNDWMPLYDSAFYEQSTTDKQNYERPLYHEKATTFPHVFKGLIGKNYYPFRQSPFGNTLTLEFAKELIEKESVGTSGQTDMLCISLSSTDYVGHRFGPNSIEMEDTYLRLDKDIESFLNYLDDHFGRDNYLLFLSADHGAPQVPDFMKENNLPGGNMDKGVLKKDLNQLLFEKYSAGDLIKSIYEYQIYINFKKADSLKLDKKAIRKTIVDYLKARPEVVTAFDYDDLPHTLLPAAQKEMFARGYFYKRSGDVQYLLRSQYSDILSIGVEHGTIYPYDTHIPLLWYGWKIESGKTYREVHMTDVAPTVCALLKIQMPGGCVGHVLPEVMTSSTGNR